MRIAEHPSPNHDARNGAVDMLILHYTGMRDASEALARLVLPAAKVSAHYFIDEDGAVTRLVSEERRAWHAGVSLWRGRADINSASIGIELVNPGHEWGYRRFPAAQMEALAELGEGILKRHAIPPRHVLAHSDIAIGRKEDPGELFDWAWLAHRSIGLWPDFTKPGPAPADGLSRLRRNLAAFGYACPPEDAPEANMTETIHAFQLHFRPELCNGMADEETLRRAAVLAAACGGV
jgi:N-acetylmuramoyl-L-alanine amidase